MELLNLYDINQKLLDKPFVRGTKTKEGEFYMITEVFIITDNKVLVTLRSPEKKTDPNKWDLVGGHVQYGEDSQTTAAREILEEVGLRIEPDQLKKIQTIPTEQLFSDIYYIKGSYSEKDLSLRKSEVSNAKFVSINEFLSMLYQNEFSTNLTNRIKQCMLSLVSVLTPLKITN